MGLGHSPSIVTSGLVLCLDAGNTKSYPGSGTTWTDLSGNSNTTTLVNSPSFSSSNGGRLSFNGSNTYCTIPSSSNLLTFGTGAFSVSFWINLSVVTNQIILTSYNSYNSNYISYFAIAYYAPSLGLGIFDSNGNIITGSTATTATWFHYCFTKTGTTFTTYKNGVQVHTSTSAANNFSGSGRTILIGGGLADYPYMNGQLANLQINNNTALTADQVLQNFNALRGRFSL
jgi:hypothetical protein